MADAHSDALGMQPDAVDNQMTDKNDNHDDRTRTQLVINTYNIIDKLGS